MRRFWPPVKLKKRKDGRLNPLASPSNLHYTVSLLRPNTHYMDVSLQFTTSTRQGAKVRLVMPVWTPGHYLVEDFSRNVLEVKCKDEGTGAALSVKKDAKNVWAVDIGSAKEVRVDYSVYAFEYDDTKSYLDSLHAMINGAGVFLYPEGMEKVPIMLSLKAPQEWTTASTGLEQTAPWEFTAPDYDVLVDSPMEVGNQDVRSFTAQGVEHQVSMYGDAALDREKFVADIKAIVEQTIKVFGNIPYKKYVFLVNFTDEAGGGLEHLNSTVCFVPRFRLFPKEEYGIMMGLFSHEFFHTWNVKRLRPMGLGPFNYSGETYTRSLWIAEGITSYYDDHLLRRTGLYSIPEYLDIFALNINLLKSLPGSRWQSAEEASFDSWIKFSKPGPNSRNVTSSYYNQGAVVGWMLDMETRKNTQGRKTLDDVMRALYEGTYMSEGRGYTDEEFEAASLKVGGESLKKIFDERVRGRAEVDYDKYLGYAGLRLTHKDQGTRERAFLGVRLQSEIGRVTVRERLAGSPAEVMGLAVGDEVIGIDGTRVGSDRLSFYVSTRKPGESVRLTIARNGRLIELGGSLTKKPPFEFRIVAAKDATEEQKAFFRSWMMGDWTPEIAYPDYERSPDRKPQFDFL